MGCLLWRFWPCYNGTALYSAVNVITWSKWHDFMSSTSVTMIEQRKKNYKIISQRQPTMGCLLLGLGLGLQVFYSATNCADNILGRFTIILQNQIARVDSFTNLRKRWVFRFRLNASISSHNLISFGKQFYARGSYTLNAHLPKVSCLNSCWLYHAVSIWELTKMTSIKWYLSIFVKWHENRQT